MMAESNVSFVVRDGLNMAERKNSAYTVSWSKFTQFTTCRGYYFACSYLPMVGRDLEYESTLAMPGIIFQRVFEWYVNERIYKNPELSPTSDGVHRWFEQHIKAFYALIRFNVEDRKDHVNVWTFFESAIGVKRKSEVLSMYPEVSEGFLNDGKPCYVDSSIFKDKHGSDERFLRGLFDATRRSLDAFNVSGVNFDLLLSEVMVYAKMGKFTLNGKLDFIYNKNHSRVGVPFSDVRDLENEYTLFDGKNTISKYTNKEQLFYYTVLLDLAYHKQHGAVGFFDWREARFQWERYDRNFSSVIFNCIQSVSTFWDRVFEIYRSTDPDKLISLYDVVEDSMFCPSKSNCRFCPIKCKHS